MLVSVKVETFPRAMRAQVASCHMIDKNKVENYVYSSSHLGFYDITLRSNTSGIISKIFT